MPSSIEELKENLKKYEGVMVATEYYLLESEMNRGISTISLAISPQLKANIEAYIFAAGALYFAGVEITMSNLQNIFVAAGLIPDKILVEGVTNLKFRNRLSYILAIAFLDSLGKKVTIEEILNVVEGFDIDPDYSKAKETIEAYNKFAPQFGLNTV
ncbi:MAG: hypothetical protein ACP5RP_04065 [Candidatus Micrarchaeia archaeon]